MGDIVIGKFPLRFMVSSICSIRWEMSGKFEQFYSNGNLEVLGHFANNEKHGTWESYYLDYRNYKRMITLQCNFKNGVQVGWQFGYNLNGTKNMSVNLNKQIHGWFTTHAHHSEYDQYKVYVRNGIIYRIDFFLDGRYVSPSNHNINIDPELLLGLRLSQICDPILINEESIQLT